MCRGNNTNQCEVVVGTACRDTKLCEAIRRLTIIHTHSGITNALHLQNGNRQPIYCPFRTYCPFPTNPTLLPTPLHPPQALTYNRSLVKFS